MRLWLRSPVAYLLAWPVLVMALLERALHRMFYGGDEMTKNEAARRLRIIARAMRYGEPESKLADEIDKISVALSKVATEGGETDERIRPDLALTP